MVEGWGRNRQNTGWQIRVGLREIVVTSFGLIGVVVMSFSLGVLAGRGEIYRVLQNWGLVKPAAPKVLQPWEGPGEGLPVPGLQLAPPASQVVSNPGSAEVKAAPLAAAPLAADAGTSEAKGRPAPVKGNITGLPAPPIAKKKGKAPSSPADKKTKEKDKGDEVQKLRAAIAPKLKFQNSLDTPSHKPPSSSAKAKPKTTSSLIKVAQYRDQQAARAKLAEMQTRGDKVTMQSGRDAEGPYYAIYRQVPSPKPTDSQSRKPQKPPTAAEKR